MQNDELLKEFNERMEILSQCITIAGEDRQLGIMFDLMIEKARQYSVFREIVSEIPSLENFQMLSVDYEIFKKHLIQGGREHEKESH